MAMARSEHVVMFSYMAQGHFIPFLKLAKLLDLEGLTVSFVTTTKCASKLKSQAVGSNISFVSLALPFIDGLPPGRESVDGLSLSESILLFCSSHKLCVPFEEWLEQLIMQNSQKPLCIITDAYLPWTADSASRFGIPLVVFHTTGAMATSVLQFLFTNRVSEFVSGDDGTVQIRDRSLNVNLSRSPLTEMLGNDSYPPELYHVLAMHRQTYTVAKERCAATIVNTFDGVDAEYVHYLEESTGKPVWPIAAPLLNPQEHVQKKSDCIRWLDAQKQNSVLYVSFGSQVFLSEDQIKALARGIEASKQHFIWAIKDPVGSNVNSCEYLPKGFLEATRDRGMVIHGWVPQLQILFHPSTGCFMSHCGWNSTLESISAGVPMVVWPMIGDQFINAKLVTERLRIALQICEGWGIIPCTDIVENTVRAAMAKKTGKEMHERAGKIKESVNAESCKLTIKAFVSYILRLGSDKSNEGL